MNTLFKTAAIGFLLLIFLSNFSFAQGLTTPCDGGDPDVDCPIDSGIILLFIVTMIYAATKIYKIYPVKESK